MARADERRTQQQSVWAWLALTLIPLVVPVLLFAVVLAFTLARDSEPGGLGEPESGLVPGAVTVSGWHQFDTSLVPDGFGPADPGHASPQALIDAMVAGARRDAGGETWITGTIVSEDADEATVRVYLPLPGYSEAFVAAEQLLTLTLRSDGWHVDDAAVRFHCRRAVRDSFCG